MGLWNHKGWVYYYDYYGNLYLAESCLTFSDAVYRDTKWKTAMAFSIIAFVFGFAAIVMTCCMYGDENPMTKYVKMLGGFYVFVALCQGLTMLQLSSNFCQDNPLLTLTPRETNVYNQECVWSTGIKLNISATVMYFCAGLACCGIPPNEGGGDEGYNDDDDDDDNKKDEEPAAPDKKDEEPADTAVPAEG